MTRSTRLQSEEGNAVSAALAPLATELEPGTVRAAIQELLALLPERPQRMLAERFGLGNGRPKTLVDIGKREGVSRERIRQIVAGALYTLRADSPPKGTARERARRILLSLCTSSGGVTTEETLLASLGGGEAKDRSAVRFLLSSFPDFSEAQETQRTRPHWIATARTTSRNGMEPAPDSSTPVGPSLETVLEAGERILEREGALAPESRYLDELRRILDVPVTDAMLRSFLTVSKRIVRNPFGDFGLRAWRAAVPRSVGDKAYLVLKAQSKPLHFRTVADEINRMRFDRKRALAGTVHNDLIRDPRFVLVGRGLYALREWGFMPGRVSDVIIRLLREAHRPLPKSEIVAEVLKQRFVKRNTVLLCLVNRSFFHHLPDGTYTLAETLRTAPRQPSPEPRPSPTS
ncbi:MAG: hypothetical protein G01um101438_498 [Parcubacteria group bacterium Gr01-1014_38]|nr:MAG: hypothetical protein G01um101438_498 [Parcubacteria group bacterium Gr01-1014_38]